MNIRRRRKALDRLPEISLTPLIDTALVLLVIFMVATPIMHNSLSIDLPDGSMKEDAQPSTNPLSIEITAQEKILLNGQPYDLENLLRVLPERVKQVKDNRVYLSCDRKVSAGKLVKVIDSIKFVAGVEHVILSTERIR